MGRAVIYTDKSGSPPPLTLYALQGNRAIDLRSMHGGQTDEDRLTIVIPRQTCYVEGETYQWPPARVNPGSVIEINDVIYGIESVEPDMGSLDMAATVAVNLMRTSNDAVAAPFEVEEGE
jgi:hypothetical protein